MNTLWKQEWMVTNDEGYEIYPNEATARYEHSRRGHTTAKLCVRKVTEWKQADA